MIRYAQALEAINAAIKPLPPGTKRLKDAAGCTTVSAVCSELNVPDFDNSAMDGFAVRARDTEKGSPAAPVRLAVHGESAAGDATNQSCSAGTAVRIMTGAPVPAGADTIVPIEAVQTLTDDKGAVSAIELTAPVVANRNIRRTGEDFRRDAQLVAGGTVLQPQHLMALAAGGVDELDVRPIPRVAVLVTGAELTSSGAPSGSGLIRDSNGPYLASACALAGGSLTRQGYANDSIEDIARQLSELGADADVIITTGGVSAGEYDYVPAAVEAAGGHIIFHKVAVRPGKPVLLAKVTQGPTILSLPGNPVAVAAGLRFFGVPLLRQLTGLAPEKACYALAREPMRKRAEFTFFGKARLETGQSGQMTAALLPGQESFRIKPLTEANCWIVIDDEVAEVDAGDRVRVTPLFPDGNLVS